MTIPNALWVFFLQGFHLYTHTLQTILTLLFLLGIAGVLGSLISSFVKKLIAFHAQVVNGVIISKDDWFEHNRKVGETLSSAAEASRRAADADIRAAAAIAEVNKVVSRIVGIDSRVQRMETAPLPNTQSTAPPEFKEFRFEVDNAVEEVRESLRLFKEEFEQRLMLLEDEPTGEDDVAVEDDPTVQAMLLEPTPKRKRKAKKKTTKRRRR
jgi:hypothetical protein